MSKIIEVEWREDHYGEWGLYYGWHNTVGYIRLQYDKWVDCDSGRAYDTLEEAQAAIEEALKVRSD